MFRKPRLHPPSSSTLGETPSSPSSAVPPAESEKTKPHSDPVLVGSSPPSAKKQKLSHPTPSKPTFARSTPGKPKQSLLKPYASIGNSAKKTFPATPFSSSQSAGKGKSSKKNSSILSFFKPVTPSSDGKAAKNGKLKGTQSDELFSRHGGYDLDVSDPEDNEEEMEENGGWAMGRSIAGELQLAKSEANGEEELFSSPIAIKSRSSILLASTKDQAEVADDVDMHEEVDEIESTAPAALPESDPTLPGPVTPLRQLPTTSLKFNPASLNLDSSRSVLFSKRGATPSPFKKLKKARPRSSSSPSADEAGFHEMGDEELGISAADRSNRDIGEFMVEKKSATKGKGKGKAKRNRDEAFRRDSIESSSDIVKDEEVKAEDESEEAVSPKVEEKLEDCSLESKPRRKKSIKGILDHGFEDIDDFPDEEPGFEEQESYNFDPSGRAIEAGFEDFYEDFRAFEDSFKPDDIEDTEDTTLSGAGGVKCPICAAGIGALSEQDANNHVNHCLDGNPIPLPAPLSKLSQAGSSNALTSPFFGQASVISPSTTTSSSKPRKASAFTKIMTHNAESAAWASAAKAETESHGKKAAERTCPFYKILFKGPITVDAFRYGAVPGCKAYFLSHFHSDHYVGLTSKWDHGPIWCSRVTANLVRKKLGVDPKWVKELPWEEWATFGVEGIRARGLDANHCPGSMMFLFERGKQRILHCGDFRACPEHLKHPLLAPGKDGVKGQKLDTVYLDTTYLNPKYAFPSQNSVIEACSKLCVKMEKEASEGILSSMIDTKNKKGGVGSFVNTINKGTGKKGRLLVVVGTYSIGKERVCLGIAKALNSKIFAPPNKIKICESLEDPELNARLTSNPKEAQVHMTPLMEIRAETLQEYLNTFKPSFDRIVGFRPSGWNYRPPNSRFTESPTVSTVLHSAGWRSEYSIDELVPQRGSTRESKCFGVPYSEHSSFRELSMFCCGLNIGKVVPTVNNGNATSRDKMRIWVEKWEAEKKKSGLFKVDEGNGKGGEW